jgi:hypothetical protein
MCELAHFLVLLTETASPRLPFLEISKNWVEIRGATITVTLFDFAAMTVVYLDNPFSLYQTAP